MAKSWVEETGISEVAGQLGTGAPLGALVGAGLAIVGLFSGMTSGWLAWLAIPAAAMAGSLIGDFVKKDGMVFGDHGVVKAVGNRFKPKTIPEGYSALNPDAYWYKADSAVLAKTAQVHGSVKSATSTEVMLGYQERRALDPFVEYDLSRDPRLKELRIKAKEYGDRYAVKESPEFIADVHQRERKITNLIVADVYAAYGAYGHHTLGNSKANSAEYEAVYHPKRQFIGGKPVDFAEMQKGELVCRHYAPIMSILLDDARVPNHMMISNICMVRHRNGEYLIDETYINKILTESGWDKNWKHHISPHAYVITKEGNAVVEGTTAGLKERDITPEGRIREAYVPIINGVTAEDIIIRGKTAITETPEGLMRMAYGGQDMAAPHTTDFAKDEEAIRRNVSEFNAEVQVRKAKEKANNDAKEAAKEVTGTPISKGVELSADNTIMHNLSFSAKTSLALTSPTPNSVA